MEWHLLVTSCCATATAAARLCTTAPVTGWKTGAVIGSPAWHAEVEYLFKLATRAQLMCHSCGLAYHLQCLRPPLQVVPSGETLGEPAKHADWVKHLVTKVSIRPRDVKNLVGKVACRKSGGSGPGSKAPEYGLVAFKWTAHAPECFEVLWRPSGDLVSYKKDAMCPHRPPLPMSLA